MQINSIPDLFWNSTDRRLRALWRILIQGFVWFSAVTGLTLALFFLLLLGAVFLGRWNPQDMLGSVEGLTDLMYSPGGFFAIQLSSFLATLATVWLAGRFLDRRRFADFGFRFSVRWGMDLAFGLLLGAFLMGVIFLTELAAGWVTVTGSAVSDMPGAVFPLAILIPAVIFLMVGISEELQFRGYILKNISEGALSPPIGPTAAILAAAVLSSIVFGFIHIGNPNMSMVAFLNLISAGVFLALGYIFTGELALPIGLHISWNFFQGNVFGFSVSGLEPVAARFLAIRQSGPDILTGGAFGPEGGLIGLGAMVLGSLLIILWVAVTRRTVGLAARIAEPPPAVSP